MEISGEVMDIVRARIDGTGSISVRKGSDSFVRVEVRVLKRLLGQITTVQARARVGLGWAVLVYEGGMLWELEKMYVVGLP